MSFGPQERRGQNVLRVGPPGQGKTLATARSVIESDGAEIILDPHKDSLAREVLIHASGNILYAKLSDLSHTLGFELLVPSSNPDPILRALENERRAEALVEILLRRRNADSTASTPLLEEWLYAAIMLILNQERK